ncbi:tetratricopeptide repeat-containing diguanylate cyclase [Shewanella gelidii]|uniref:tetratricopeptide repeat-containing diguanylate cyclase n=1 Tax=Shewanella gelidii TaxID=1642821 RepID=UPI00166DBE95|nr:tetratricopeptide repeat-containing diguanylate cyclase [Shewanella gelidii]MCL1096534.1 diguanylate cyclase [Shewanella gelidii]
MDDFLIEIENKIKTQPNVVPDLVDRVLESNQALTAEQRARLLLSQSHLKLLSADYGASLILLNQAEEQRPPAHILTKIYHYQSTAYLLLQDYDNALKVIAANLSRIEKIEDLDVKIISYIRLASVFDQLGAYEEAMTYALLARDLTQDTDPHNYCSAAISVAVSHLELGHLSKAKSGFFASKRACIVAKHDIVTAMSIKGLGHVALKMGDYPEAEKRLLEALKAYQPFQYQQEITAIQALLSEVYLALGQVDKAHDYAQRVLAAKTDNSDVLHLEIATRVLSGVMQQQQQYELAYQYLRDSNSYQDQIMNAAKAKANAYQTAKFNSAEKEREIALLNKDRELYLSMQLTKEQEHANMVLLTTLLVGGVFFLGILVVVGYMQKQKFMRLSKIDSLTGIMNRGAGQDMGEDALIKVQAQQGSYSVVLFDMDHFKSINDNFGHATGDWVLKKVADTISGMLKNSDIFARVGGEEFVILLPFADEAHALGVAESCRLAIESIDTKYSGQDFSITASFGIAHLAADDLSLDPILHRADVALYHAKEQGRNLVSKYVAEMEGFGSNAAVQNQLALN